MHLRHPGEPLSAEPSFAAPPTLATDSPSPEVRMNHSVTQLPPKRGHGTLKEWLVAKHLEHFEAALSELGVDTVRNLQCRNTSTHLNSSHIDNEAT